MIANYIMSYRKYKDDAEEIKNLSRQISGIKADMLARCDETKEEYRGSDWLNADMLRKCDQIKEEHQARIDALQKERSALQEKNT